MIAVQRHPLEEAIGVSRRPDQIVDGTVRAVTAKITPVAARHARSAKGPSQARHGSPCLRESIPG
jgi:hypothetical protein